MIVLSSLMPPLSLHLMNVTQLFAVSSFVMLSTELAGFVFFPSPLLMTGWFICFSGFLFYVFNWLLVSGNDSFGQTCLPLNTFIFPNLYSSFLLPSFMIY